MSERDDRIYYLERAKTERAIATFADDNAVALAHLRLADEYERRAAQLAQEAEPVSMQTKDV